MLGTMARSAMGKELVFRAGALGFRPAGDRLLLRHLLEEESDSEAPPRSRAFAFCLCSPELAVGFRPAGDRLLLRHLLEEESDSAVLRTYRDGGRRLDAVYFSDSSAATEVFASGSASLCFFFIATGMALW